MRCPPNRGVHKVGFDCTSKLAVILYFILCNDSISLPICDILPTEIANTHISEFNTGIQNTLSRENQNLAHRLPSYTANFEVFLGSGMTNVNATSKAYKDEHRVLLVLPSI